MTFNKVLRLEGGKTGYSAPHPPIFFGLVRFQGLLTLSSPGAGGGSQENFGLMTRGAAVVSFTLRRPPAPHASSIRLC